MGNSESYLELRKKRIATQNGDLSESQAKSTSQKGSSVDTYNSNYMELRKARGTGSPSTTAYRTPNPGDLNRFTRFGNAEFHSRMESYIKNTEGYRNAVEMFFRSDPSKREDRQKWYVDNQLRLEELYAERDSLMPKQEIDYSYSESGDVIQPYAYSEDQHYFGVTANPSSTETRLAEVNKEISELETQMRLYQYGEGGFTAKTVDDYYDVTQSDDFAQMSANRDYANPTREDLIKYDTMMDGSTWYNDGNGNLFDAYGNKIDRTNVDEEGKIIHPVAQGDDYAVKDRLGLYLSASEDEIDTVIGSMEETSGTWESVIKDGFYGNWELLDETEVGIYYAILGTEGQEAADKYLADMTTELNRRATMNERERLSKAFDEASTLERIGMSVATTPYQILGSAAGLVDNAIRLAQGKDINPYSVAHTGSHFSTTVRGKQAEEWDKTGFEIPVLGFTAGDIYQTGMSVLDSIAAIGIGGRAGATLLGMGAAENEATRLYQQGASMEQIALASVAAGVSEMLWENMSIESLVKIGNAATKRQVITNILKQAGVEAFEEGGTEITNLLTNSVIMAQQSDWNKLVEEAGGDEFKAFMQVTQQVAQAMFGGFLSGAGMSAGPSIVSYVANQAKYTNAGKAIMGAEGGVDALKQLALEVAGVSTEGMRNDLTNQANNVTGDTVTGKILGKYSPVAAAKNNANANRIGKLYETVGTAYNAQNQADIAKSLERKGLSSEKANAVAEALLADMNGLELTAEQKNLLSDAYDSPAVAAAIKNIVKNELSTMGQRNKTLEAFKDEVNNKIKLKRIIKELDKRLAKEQRKMKAPEEKVSTEYKIGDESQYEVSEDGKITLDGREVNLNDIRRMDDGSVVVVTDDGQTADAGEVKYSSEGQALVYEAYTNIEATTSNPVIANMDMTSRSALAKAYDPNSGVDARTYIIGSNHSFWYGFEGISMNEKTIPKDSLVWSISKEQRDFAYELGRKASAKVAATQAKGIQSAYNKAVEKLGGKEAAAAVANRKKGKVVLNDGIKVSSMTRQQKASYELSKVIAEATGTNIRIYHGVKEYGKYNRTTGEIWLNINAMFTGKSMMAFTLGHELVHMAKQWSPDQFKAFADYLLEQYGKQGVSVEALIQEQIVNAKDNGITLNEHEAYEEVIADACMRMLLDSNAVEKMASFKEKNPSLWQKIVDRIREFIHNIRMVFKGAEPDSLEAKYFKKFDADAKKILENLFVEMVMDAGEHLSTIRNAFGKGTVVEVNADGEFTLAKGEDSNGAKQFLYNDYTWERGGRETLQAALKAEGYSDEDIKAALTIMDGKHDLVKKLGEQLPEQSRINQATITTDLKDGHSVLSALVSNGDYPVNIDLLMVCKKRKAYQRVINRLCETGMIKQATVDALAIAEINKILGKYGFETACLGCFVESRRLRIQEWANTIVKEWNSEVKKRNPNAKPFGFGKGKATLDLDEIMQLVGELESGGAKNDQGNLNLGQGSAVKRMGVLLDKVPSLRKTLSVEDLITPDGLTALRSYDSNLFSMVKSRYGSNSPKFVQEFNPYNHELAKYGKVPSEYKSLREYLYAIGGARMQSFSDFIVENWFDYCQIVADLAARKLPMHTYTKEIALVKLFGLTGIKINMSLIPDIDKSLGKDFAGLTRNENGELELIWADKDRFKKTVGKSYMQSINFADAIALQNDPRYSSNVGTIAIGISDKQIVMMLDDSRIRMVIPYHASGMNPIFADLMGTSFYKDYTMVQNTTVKQLYNSKGEKVSLKLDKTQTGKLTSGFQFNETLQKLGDARAAAQAYKDWCADASKHTITIKGETYAAELTPKFDSFSWHDNYYKLLEDFNTYDCISEKAAPQGDVQQTYPEDFDSILEAELKSQEGHRQKQVANQAFDKAMAEIEAYLGKHTKADTVFYAEQHGVKLGAKDKKLGAEDKRKLADLRKGEKYSMPKVKAISPSNADIQRNMEHIAKMDSVCAVDARKLERTGKKPSVIFTEHFESWGWNIYSDDLGDVEITKQSVRDEVRHGITAEKIASTEAIPSVIRDGKIIFAGLKPGTTVYRIVVCAPITIGGKPYYMGVMLQRDSNTQRLYLHNVVIEEETTNFSPAIPLTTGADENNDRLFITNILQAALNVKYDMLTGVKNKSPNSRGMPHRQLLADAFDELVQTPKEREMMDQYRANITKVEEVQDRLQKVRGKIRELTKAKGDKAKIAALNKTAADLADLIDKYDRKLLGLEASKPLRDVLKRAKAAEKLDSDKLMAEYRKQVQERFDSGVEGRRKTEMRHKIQNVVGELNRLLLTNDKKHHVPDSLKKAVADALSLVNMDTVGAEERAAKYADLIAKETDPDKIDAYTVTMENLLRQGEKMGQKLKELRDAYEEIQNSDDPDIANAYDPVIAGSLNELSQSIGNTSLRNMSLAQLQDVYDMYRMVLTRVRDANKSLIDSIKESITERASKVIGEVRKAGGAHTHRASALDPVKKFSWDNLKPVYAMERIGSSTLTEAYNNVRAGEDTWAKDVVEAREYYLDKSKKYGYDSWDFEKKYTFESTSGVKFELTLEQIMALYAYSKRDQAGAHLRLGGFVFDSNIETHKETVEEKDGKIKRKKSILKYKVNTADAHQISVDILADITGSLTKDQRAFVDEMQDYLSTVMGAKGNEVTMKMYGVKLFKEKFYFPLKSAKQFMFEQNEVAGEVRIKNSGFTNKTKPNANNPIILNNFMDVWANHVNDMSMYHSFVLPLEDFNRIFNYNSPKAEGSASVSVKGTIQNAYDHAAVSYVKQLITDLNGGAVSDPRETVAKSMLAKFKKAKVFSSLSVVIQQPSAIGRAFALINPKYFKPTKDGMNHAALWDELKKYAPVAIIKEMGYFDTNMGKSTQDFITGKEYSSIKEKAKAIFTDGDYRDEVLSKAPALADELAWCAIWNAVKRETVSTHKNLRPGSEAFLKAAGERFTEVITKTQMYDSVLARSANMRSKSGMMSMVTSFMAEPTTTINMIEDALIKAKKGNRGYAARVFASVAVSILLNNALVAIVYAMRDDDEDETFAEKYAQALVSGLLDDANPLTYYPYLKDIWSLFQGYDIERSDMSLVSDLADAAKRLVTAYSTEDGDLATAWWDIAGSVANLGGIPVNNIRRDVKGAINLFDTLAKDMSGRSTTWMSLGDVLGETVRKSLPVVGWLPGDSKADNLYDAIISGDTVYVNRLKGSYKDESAYNSAVRKALRENDPRIRQAAEAEINGDPAERVRIARLIIADGFGQDNVVAAINAEINAINSKKDDEPATKKVSGLYNATDFAVEIGNGNKTSANAAREDIIQTAMANGKTKAEAEASFESSAKTALKEEFLAGGVSSTQALNALTTYCGDSKKEAERRIKEWEFEDEHGFSYSECKQQFLDGNISESEVKSTIMSVEGKTADEAEEQISKWEFEGEYGFAYDDKKQQYLAGNISEHEMRTILMDVGGKTAEEADLQIEAYDWEAQGYEGATPAAVRDYHEYCAQSNVPKDTYLHIRSFANNTENDKDENGNSISYSAMKKIMAEIDAQPGLTAAQKTAIARSLGWAERNINRYKLW